jgi:dUTP pyrophosphatase
MKMRIKRARKGAILPEYQTDGAAGFDFHACIEKSVEIEPGGIEVFPTGLSVEIPEDYELQIRGRSGLAFKHKVTMLNGIGTIDSDFRGEMSIMLKNHGEEIFVVEPGMRIAQGVVSRFEKIEWEEVGELSETNRKGGFGSTGLK